MLQEGGPLPGPKSGLLSNTQKWNVQGDTSADKARDFVGKRNLGGEQQGKGTQENCSAMWLAPFDLSWILSIGGRFLFSHSFPRPPVVRQLMQVATSWPGQVVSVRGSPNNWTQSQEFPAP